MCRITGLLAWERTEKTAWRSRRGRNAENACSNKDKCGAGGKDVESDVRHCCGADAIGMRSECNGGAENAGK